MKNLLLIGIALMLLASCAGPRYTYNFDYYDYNSGRKAPAPETQVLAPPDASTMLADVNADPVVVAPARTAPANIEETRAALAKKYSEMSKAEKKEFRQAVKAEIKQYKQAIKDGKISDTPDATTAMDNDLKLAIIFGAVGLTLTLFGGINEAFWILGVIAIVVGVVFLIKWLVRQ